MRTIVIIGGIILAGATVIAVVQNNRTNEVTPEVHQSGDSGNPSSGSPESTPATNPAHGVAGHRCDLPVGAPLTTNSGNAPAQQPQINMNTAPQQPGSAAPVAAPSGAGIKMNPAHGMPGHRCDIQVGAPLT